MAQLEERQAAVEARRVRLARLLEQDGEWTNEELAEELGVDARTITRDRAALKADGRVLVKKKLSPAEQREDYIKQGALNTYQEAQAALLDLKESLLKLKAELGFGNDVCPCCGRAKLVVAPEVDPSDGVRVKKRGAQDALLWGALFKGHEALTKQIELLARMLGQLESNVVVIRDADLASMTIINHIAHIQMVVDEIAAQGQEPFLLQADGSIHVGRVTKALFTKIYLALWGENEARQRRTPPLQGIVDGTFWLPGERPPEIIEG